MNKLSKYVNEEKKYFIDFLRLLIPDGKKEKIVFYSSLFLYFILGLYLLYSTSIIDSKKWLVDAYWGFDSSAVFLRGYTNIPRHPLLTVFTKPLMIVGDFFNAAVSYKMKGIVFILFCNICVSFSVLYIYRYIKQVIGLNRQSVLLLIIFTVLNPTFILLSFTDDTFTFSLPFLCFALFYYSNLIKQNKKSPLVPQIILTTVVGGITITNIIKVIIPSCFTQTSIRVQFRNLFIAGLVFSLLVLVMDFKYGVFSDLLGGIIGGGDERAVDYHTGHIRHIIDGFFGAGLILPEIITLDKHMMLNISEFPNSVREIVPAVYDSIWYYIPLVVIYGFVLWSIIKNIKNKHVVILILVWGCDILIHLVFKFGMNELYLYAGHWIYVIPLLIAWGFKSLPPKYLKVYNILFALFIAGITINNVYHFVEFITLSQNIYPPIT